MNPRKKYKLLIPKQKVLLVQKVYGILFLLGFYFCIFLLIYSMWIYNQTIIDWKIPFSIWILVGLCVTPIVYNFYKESSKKSEILWQFGWSCLTAGSIVIFCLFMINNFFLSPIINSESFSIIDSGIHHTKGGGSCENKYFLIEIEDFEKKIEFDCTISLNNSKAIILKTQKGFLGYNVIVGKQIIYK